MQPNLSFLSVALNAILKAGSLLKWKVRLVKDARLSLPLTKVMNIARVTFPLLDVLCLSLPRPRLRHGRQLALLFNPNLTLNLYTLFFAMSLALLPQLLPNYQLAGFFLSKKHGFATFVHERLKWTLFDQSRPTSETEWLCVNVDGYKIVYAYKPPPIRFARIRSPSIPTSLSLCWRL